MPDTPHDIDLQRRQLMLAGTVLAGAALLPLAACSRTDAPASTASPLPPPSPTLERIAMGLFTTKDDVQIYFKDWGPKDGPVVTLSHGWPLNADSWESQAYHLAANGFRVIAHDRRGHGRSSQPWDGNDMDHYADDLAQLIEHLDLKDITMFGFSTGGGEVARYIGRHGTQRVKKAGLVSAVPPLMLKTEANPGGLPIDVFDGIRAGLLANRAQLFKDIPSGPFFGYNRPGAKPSQGVIDAWWLQGMMGGHKNTYDSIKAFSETDFTEDLRSSTCPRSSSTATTTRSCRSTPRRARRPRW